MEYRDDIRHAIVLVDGSVLVEQADGSFRPETGQTDWDRVRRASDEEIAAAVAEDPDAAPLMSEEELASVEWTRPGAEPPGDAVLFD
ncbi:MAG: hypothetical protein H6843_10220 [Rhodospirillaceae bacterium]|nr:hypothetical protein [Rhodospirillaceae bacterium]